MNRACLAFVFVCSALIAAGDTRAETAECRALLKQRESECQRIAERLQNVCPPGQNPAARPAECEKLVGDLKSLCTHKPCGAAPRRAKKKAKKKSKAP